MPDRKTPTTEVRVTQQRPEEERAVTVPFPSVPMSAFNVNSTGLPTEVLDFQAAVMKWTRDMGMLCSDEQFAKADRYGIGVLCYYVYHHLPSYQDTLILSNFVMWTTMIDDYITENPTLTKEKAEWTLDKVLLLMDLIDGTVAESGDDNIEYICEHVYSARGLADLFSRRNADKKHLVYDLKRSLEHWFDSMRIAYRNKSLPNVEQFLEVRVWDGATVLYCDALPALCSAFATADLDEELVTVSGCHFLMTEMKRFVAKHIAGVNDIIAVKKEYERGDLNNLVMMLHKVHECHIHRAIEEAVDIVNNVYIAFENLKELLPSPAKEVDRFAQALNIETMERWMYGHLYWYYCPYNERYTTGYEVNNRPANEHPLA